MSAATEPATRDAYIVAVRAGELFADPVYQRDLDRKRVAAMAAAFDRRLVGVLEVSERSDGRFAILDGQHRHATVLEAAPAGAETPLVCQVYAGLSIEDEARLFHEINARRKALSWWDRWRARRGAGDPRVISIEQLLTDHGLQVNPGQADGNIRATHALEVIVDQLGDLELLDSVLRIVLASFGRSVDALDGMVMQAIAYVLLAYDPDEVDVNRLVEALTRIPPRQIRARAVSLREVHKGTLPRLCAAVIIERYNAQPGRNAEPFLVRLPAIAKGNRDALARRAERRHEQPPAEVVLELPAVDAGEATHDEDLPTPAVEDKVAIPAGISDPVPGFCRCNHSRRLHDDEDGDGTDRGVCLATDDCDCTVFVQQGES